MIPLTEFIVSVPDGRALNDHEAAEKSEWEFIDCKSNFDVLIFKLYFIKIFIILYVLKLLFQITKKIIKKLKKINKIWLLLK